MNKEATIMLGNSKKNKWCCFCKYWYDPTLSALKPKQGRDLFEVDINKKNKCLERNLVTQALSTCPKFSGKF